MARAPNNYNHCITAVETAAGRSLSEADLEQVFSAVHGRIRRYVREGMSDRDAAVRAGAELGADMRVAAAVEKRAKLINEATQRALWDFIGNQGGETMRIRAKLTGTEGSIERGGLAASTDAKAHSLTAELLGPFVADLEAAGLRRALSRGDPAFDRDIIRELWSLDSGGPAVTRNAQARQAAEIIHRHTERARLMQNEAGAWIGKLENYVTRQSHDMERIRAAGFERWRDHIRPRLDERTFDSLPDMTPEAVNDFLRSVYNALASGVHETAQGAVRWGDVGTGTGPANLARRVSEQRKLIFRDGDAWADYNQTFGVGTLMDSVRTSIEHAGRNTALLRDWGANPEAMYRTIVDQAMVRAKNRGDFAEVDRLRGQFNERLFDVITGKSSVPENMTLAKITVGVQALQTMSKLGGVVIASVPDIAVNASVLRHNGIGLFESYTNQLASLLPQGAARREVAHLAGVGMEGILGSIASRFTAMDSTRGFAARAVDLFHRVNLLNWWTTSLKQGAGTMLMHNLARSAGRSFDQLQPALQTTLGRYGIRAADWDAVRGSARRAGDGRDYIIPVDIEDAALRSKFQTYITDQVREAMTEPDAYARAVGQGGGLQAGTYGGMAARLLMQFKTYPTTFMRRHLNRELYRGQQGGMDVAGITHLMVATTLLGYAAFEMRQMSRGRHPQSSNAEGAGDYAKLVARAMVQGGGLGFYGDVLFGDETRGGGGAGSLGSFLGPTAGTLGDTLNLIQLARTGGVEGNERSQRDLGPAALRLFQDTMPGANLFYLRGALDYLFFYRLQEAMNPGYLARYERRMRDQGVTFMLSPSSNPYR